MTAHATRYDAADVRAAAVDPLTVARALGLAVAPGARPGRARVCCPWHAEKNPSCALAVRDGRVVAYCHSCHAGGDIISLVAAVEGLDARTRFQAVLERAAERLGVAPRVASGPIAAAPRSARDASADLAMRVERAAEDWIAGRAVRVDPVIEHCPDPLLVDTLADLRALDVLRRSRDRRLSYLAAAHGAHARVR